MNTITVKEAKAKLAEYIRKADNFYEEYVITRNGKPTAALISYDELESIKETLELESDPSLIKELRRARSRAKKGMGKRWAELKQEMGL